MGWYQRRVLIYVLKINLKKAMDLFSNV